MKVFFKFLDAAGSDWDLAVYAFDRIDTGIPSWSAGGLGREMRNDIERRKGWMEVPRKTEDLFRNLDRLPYRFARTAVMPQTGTDYKTETGSFSTTLELRSFEEAFATVQNIQKELDAAGKRRAWGFENWPAIDTKGKVNPVFSNDGYVTVDAELINDNNEKLGIQKIRLRYSIKDGGWSSTNGNQTALVFKGVKAADVTQNLEVKVKVQSVRAGFMPADPSFCDKFHTGFYLNGGIICRR